jgi:hypothetical protein
MFLLCLEVLYFMIIVHSFSKLRIGEKGSFTIKHLNVFKQPAVVIRESNYNEWLNQEARKETENPPPYREGKDFFYEVSTD